MNYCPICAGVLLKVEQNNPEIDWSDATQAEIDKYLKDDVQTPADHSIWYECTGKGCFGKEFPLVLHHPLRGTKSAPGDSFSLTWLK